MTAARLPVGVGLWSGFLDQLPADDAVETARQLEASGVRAIWLQEFSGVDPFVRAALYLRETRDLTVALGVATIQARDPEAMVAAGWALEDAFPGRFILGLGVSHRQLVEARGGSYDRPLTTLRRYLESMDAAAGRRTLPPRFLGGLGPRMVELAGEATDGVHTYFCPVTHTAASRASLGEASWLAPSQMVAVEAGPDWGDDVRPYLGLCLSMPNYRRSLLRFGFTEDDLEERSDALLDALVVRGEPSSITERLDEQFANGADHVVVQFVAPPHATTVVDLVKDGVVDLDLCPSRHSSPVGHDSNAPSPSSASP